MVEKQRNFFQKSSELEDLPIMILSGQLELEEGKRICNDASTAPDTWLMYAKRYFHMRPYGTDELRMKGSEVRIGPELNYEAITKEIRNDFLAGEERTDTAVSSFTDDEISIRSVGIVYNQY